MTLQRPLLFCATLVTLLFSAASLYADCDECKDLCRLVDEYAQTEKNLATLANQRSREHARNVIDLLFHPENLTKHAGHGLREGFEDAGPVRE